MTAGFVSGYTWRFSLVVYTNIEAINQSNNQLDLQYASIYVNGVWVDSVQRANRTVVGDFDQTYKNEFYFEYTFSGPRVYVVSFREENRNNNIKNIAGGASDPYPFHIETYILASSLSANSNSTPELFVPPLDKAAENIKFVHNAGAFDSDGDSLSYKLITPKQGINKDVPSYSFMDGLSINPVTGDVVWDKPTEEGLYNIAILIEEWRDGVRIGYVLRDMQIEVEPTENKPPVIYIPEDTCILANSIFSDSVWATDPDGDRIFLTGYGGVFNLGMGSALFDLKNPNPQDTPAVGYFTWQTTCQMIRDEPYQVVFKAEDLPPNDIQLADLKTLILNVVAPPVENLTATGGDKFIQLEWDLYGCSSLKDGRIEIYRIKCDSLPEIPDPCFDESLEVFGFEKIGDVSIEDTLFVDNENGKGLSQGNFYTYILYVKPGGKMGGKGAFSNQVVAVPNENAPIPVKVSVLKTDSLNGKIQISWEPPFDFDSAKYTPPYKYKIKRGNGIFPDSFSEIASLDGLMKLTFIDSLVNTYDPYAYTIEFLAGDPFTSFGSSDVASTVNLKLNPGSKKAFLNWDYDVPWNNENQVHKIFKKKYSDSVYGLLEEVYVSSGSKLGSFTDKDLIKGDTICYYVETVGEYCQEGFPGFIFNKSQEKCITPLDSTKPCPPELFLDPLDCSQVELGQNFLSWIPDRNYPCNPDIAYYKVYFSPRENWGADYLDVAVDTTFIHRDLTSLAGCYEVTALNEFHVESEKSNRVCTDICVAYETPNLFTPNNDGANDYFRPLKDPLNADKVIFTVFNRWGSELYSFEGDPYIYWDGKDKSGQLLSDGVYFYEVDVKFKRRLNEKDDKKLIKGWVQIATHQNTYFE